MTLLSNYCRHFIFSKSSNKDCTCFHESNLYVIYYSHHHSHHHHRHNHHHHPHHYNTLIITIIIMIIFVFIKLLYSKRTSSDITASRNSFLIFFLHFIQIRCHLLLRNVVNDDNLRNQSKFKYSSKLSYLLICSR